MVMITSFRCPESVVKLQQRNVSIMLDKKSIGNGTLFISEKTLAWQKGGEGSVGFSLDYYNVSLHAVSKDPNVCEQECIYILTDPHIEFDGSSQQNNEENDSDAESEPNLSELLLIPEDRTQIHNIYEAIRICQELNPDAADVDDEENNLYEDAEEETDQMFMEAESEHLDINGLAERLQNNSVNVRYNYEDGNHEAEEFEDAD